MGRTNFGCVHFETDTSHFVYERALVEGDGARGLNIVKEPQRVVGVTVIWKRHEWAHRVADLL
jgi:hypothetical protein